MFIDKYLILCKEKGVSPSFAATEAGISKSLVTKWKRNKIEVPSPEVLQKLAAYFGTTVSDLLDEEIERETKKEQLIRMDELSDDEVDLIKLFRKLPEEIRDSYPALLEAALKAQGLL